MSNYTVSDFDPSVKSFSEHFLSVNGSFGNDSKVEFALGYLAAGFAVLQLKPLSKEPFGTAWQETTDPDAVAEWFKTSPNLNYGIRPGPEHVIIDVDGEVGRKALAALEDEHDLGAEDFNTLTQRTRKGVHYIFSLPEGHPPVGNGNSFPDGIDTRGHGTNGNQGGYVVGAGSVVRYEVTDADGNPTGELATWTYTIENFAPIKEIPAALLAYIRPASEKAENTHEWLVEADDPKNIERFRDFLTRTAAPAKADYERRVAEYEDNMARGEQPDVPRSPQDGNPQAFSIAGMGRDYALSLDTTVAEMVAPRLDGWNACLSYPWTAEELLNGPARNLYRYPHNAAGCRALRDDQDESRYAASQAAMDRFESEGNVVQLFAPSIAGEASASGVGGKADSESEPAEQPNPFGTQPINARQFKSLLDFFDTEPEPVEELVDELVEKNITTFLCGEGGSNKSRLAIQIGLCVSAGKNALDRKTEKARFLYMPSEDDEKEVHRRVYKIANALGLVGEIEPGYADWLNCHGTNSVLAIMSEHEEPKVTPLFHRIRNRLKSIPGHKVVVWDSCYDFVRFKGTAKINEDVVNEFVKGLLDGLCAETDSTFIVVWHPSQAGVERGNASGWSVAWHNAPRGRISLRRDKKVKDKYHLKVEKRNHGRDGFGFPLWWSNGVLLTKNQIAQTGQPERFHELCVNAAVEWSQKGLPIQRQSNVMNAIIAEITDSIGYTVSSDDVKGELFKAAANGELKYINSSKYVAAGFYPADGAEEVAKVAKKKQAEAKKKQSGEDD